MVAKWAVIPLDQEGKAQEPIKNLEYEAAVEMQSQFEKAFLISLSRAIPLNPDQPKPAPKKSDRGAQLWCPYCGDWRMFGARSRQCPICGHFHPGLSC